VSDVVAGRLGVESELRIDFWDVGQGDCTILTLPDKRLLLIDVGRKGSPVVDWLNERRIAPEIAAIILTHNDADHVGALCTIVAEHKRRIGCIWMSADRNRVDLKETAAFRCVEEAERNGYFSLRRLEAGQTIWEDAVLDAHLRVVHPSFAESVMASTPNRTSGLILLESGGQTQIAWPGDLDNRESRSKTRRCQSVGVARSTSRSAVGLQTSAGTAGHRRPLSPSCICFCRNQEPLSPSSPEVRSAGE
jgi:beta-lactamase superfamily II metal-dependent hydrolase